MKKTLFSSILTLILLIIGSLSVQAQGKMNVLKIKSAKELHSFFQFTGNDALLIAGHRGGMVKGYPENSIANF